MIDYNKRLVEVDEILNYLSQEELQKIPEDVRKIIKANKDKDYIWKYDESKKLKDQHLSRDTIAILSYLNMEYLLNEEQKKFMQQLHEYNEKKSEEKKAELYKKEDLFKNRQKNVEKAYNDEVQQKISLTTYKKQNLFARIINNIKDFFKILK